MNEVDCFFRFIRDAASLDPLHGQTYSMDSHKHGLYFFSAQSVFKQMK